MALSFGIAIKRPQAPGLDAYGLELGHGWSRAECSVITIDQYFRNDLGPAFGPQVLCLEKSVHGHYFNLWAMERITRLTPARRML
jgi:hypothetical protein